ncbi:MAG: hypothetical protein JWN70_3303 [Planctomycetaceae bacterium]|nr:hypothetical protein [Planctomycetaceae bacterium]
MNTLRSAVGDADSDFTVSLDGMSGESTYSQVMSAAQRGAVGPRLGGYTDWDMSELFQGGQSADTTFVRGDVPVENPFAP